MTKVAFLDRDGTLNKDIGYLYRWEDFQWVNGALDFLLALKEKSYVIAIVTNQSGIARNYYNNEDVETLHNHMNRFLKDKFEICIDHFAYCPHHPDFTGICECRKPGIGMFKQVQNKVAVIDKKSSFMLGDKESDFEAGKKFGVRSYILSNDIKSDEKYKTFKDILRIL